MRHRVIARRSDTFKLHGKRYRVGADGVAAVRLVNEALEAIDRGSGLWRFRTRIRGLRSRSCRAVLSYLASRTEDEQTRLVAIWLRGQLSQATGTEAIAAFATDSKERVRFAVAKAMHRMSGWSVLAELQRDHSERVRRVAAPRIRRSFTDRLGSFSQSVDIVESNAATPGELYVSPDCEIQDPVTLRSNIMIRSVLERIRELLGTGRTWQPR